ncbi:MAG: FtsX-like permease family protein, partial [Candidatus Enterosoma sp.]|nr:FtsX-like permease family protein [Candidatus Enterosoma sp.]
HERMRDIATLKVLGFQKREIGLTLMFEIVSLTFAGVLFGLFAGYPFMLLVLKTNIVEIVDYLYHISLLSYFAAFLFTFVVAFLMNLYFSNKTKKIPMVESLKSIE